MEDRLVVGMQVEHEVGVVGEAEEEVAQHGDLALAAPCAASAAAIARRMAATLAAASAPSRPASAGAAASARSA